MFNEGKKSLDCSAAVSAKRVLQIAADRTVSHNTAVATTSVVGVSEFAAGIGEGVGVNLINKSGTVEIEAVDAIAVGEDAFAAADGKISALPAVAGDYRRIGMAMEESTADGDVIEILPDPSITVVTVV